MVRKWSTVPISLSYTTRLRPVHRIVRGSELRWKLDRVRKKETGCPHQSKPPEVLTPHVHCTSFLSPQTRNAAAVGGAVAVASGKYLKQTMDDNAHENKVLSGKARADPNNSDLFDDISKP
jgi:hypothetical protein